MKLWGALLVVPLFLGGCPNQSLNDSKASLAAGNKAYGQKQYDTAIAEFEKSTLRYPEQHLAWYGEGAAQAGKREWAKAADAFGHAVQISDKDPMYQMWYGISLYEKAVQQAIQDQAKKENKKPEEVQPDLSTVNFEKPMQHLEEALKLNGDLWRAHYYLGKVDREVGKPKEAATEFSAAIKSDPRESGPYVALGELYRKWDYTDEAIKVTSQGVVNVPGSNEVSDIWFVLGMGYDDKRMDDKAIEAFDKSIESKKDNHKAKFQRGQAYFRKGDYIHAKRDLEDFSKSGGASLEFAKQEASKMLMDIAAKSAADSAPAAPPTQKESPADLVKKGAKRK
ncbi:MAG: tetratricopeptide repeat protein [Kofleriaceae bacterium]